MAVLNSYNYSKPKNYVNVNIVDKNAMPERADAASAAKARETEKTDQYLEQKVLSAKPEELTYMLYEGLVRFIKKALIMLEGKEYEKVHNNTVKALDIVTELRSTLNMEIEISSHLDSLYEYLEFKLFGADIDKDAALYEEALVIAEDFKETWKQAFHLK